MAKVTLDMETFKALASSTRLLVLRALDERRKTLSELAKELELNKATVHEHLGILLATGLIKKRDDEGRKWIYYELTWQGERLLHPQETTTFAVLLGFSVAAAGGGVMMLGAALNWWWADKRLAGEGIAEGGAVDRTSPEMQSDAAEPADDGAADGGQHAAAAPASGNGTQASSPAPEKDMLEAEGDTTNGFFSTDDPDGILAILLVATAILLAVFAFVIRRARRGSA